MRSNRTRVVALIAVGGAFACNKPKTNGLLDGTVATATAPVAAGTASSKPVDTGQGTEPKVIKDEGKPCKLLTSDQLTLPLLPQMKTQLCWAGVAQMVASFFSIANPQLDQVQDWEKTCQPFSCRASASEGLSPCNQPHWPKFERVNIHAEKLDNRALPFEDLKREITCGKRPVAFTWNLGGDAGHIMVAYGYDGNEVLVADPKPACDGNVRAIAYEVFRDGENPPSTRHWRDYYAFYVMEQHAAR